VIQFQIRLEIGTDGDGGAGEFVFEAHDAIDTDGDLSVIVIVVVDYRPIISTEVGAGADIPFQAGCIAADIANELIETRDSETIVPETGNAFERGIFVEEMLKGDGTGPELDANRVGVTLAFGLGKGSYAKETG